MRIEVCANSFRSALAAMRGGAHRIELCQNLEQGGTTPSAADIALSVEHLHAGGLDVFVLIRPRAGDFVYGSDELEVMNRDIAFCKDHGVDGVVIGALTENFEIDLPALHSMVDLAQPMQLTFHRAFDFIRDPFEAVEQLVESGVHRILTSGQKSTAVEGRQMIKRLIEQAADRITILPGSGINSQNILDLRKATGAIEFHLSAKRKIKGKNGKNFLSDNDYFLTDWEEVKKVVELVNSDW